MELDRVLTHSHGRALSRLLAVCGAPPEPDRVARVRAAARAPESARVVSLLGPFLERSAGSEPPGLLAAA